MVERLLNHLLAAEPWATERLRAFAGQQLQVLAGPLTFAFAVETDGRLVKALADQEPAVTVTLPADTPVRLLLDRPSIMANARLSGNADFAESLAFVFRNLRWDAEADVSRVTGDIVARRLVQGGKALWQWQQEAGARSLANVAEYLGDDSGLLVARIEVEDHYRAVDGLRDDVARLEKRLARLG